MRAGATRSLGLLALAWPLFWAAEAAPDGFPGAQLRTRLEVHLARKRAALLPTLSHYGLVFRVEPAELSHFMRQIHVHGEGPDLALGVVDRLELHGGGLLRLLLDHWRPEARAPRLDDAFWFQASRRSLELGTLYRAHQSQIFLPLPDAVSGVTGAELPDTPQLPRMRLRFTWPPGRSREIETDSYKFLGVLIDFAPDPSATWINHRGQSLSVDLLMRHVREQYLASRDTPIEPEDHSNLHLVELLLAYAPQEADPIKAHFLAVELRRREFDAADASLLLAHYAASLGRLVANPHVRWSEDEKRLARGWLRELERERFADLDAVELNRLAHLLQGLRAIQAHREALE